MENLRLFLRNLIGLNKQFMLYSDFSKHEIISKN